MELILDKKTYVSHPPKARMVRRAIGISQDVNFNKLTPEELDVLVQFVVDIFGKNFTIDEVYDGLDADKLIPTITECIQGVVGGTAAKIEEFPNVQTGS